MNLKVSQLALILDVSASSLHHMFTVSQFPGECQQDKLLVEGDHHCNILMGRYWGREGKGKGGRGIGERMDGEERQGRARQGRVWEEKGREKKEREEKGRKGKEVK